MTPWIPCRFLAVTRISKMGHLLPGVCSKARSQREQRFKWIFSTAAETT